MILTPTVVEIASASPKARNLPIGRALALSAEQVALAEPMCASWESVPMIAETLGPAAPP